MTISLFQYTDIDEGSGDPVFPPQIRLAGQAIANTYLQLCNSAVDGSGTYYPIRLIRVSNDDGTTGVRFRITTAGSGQDATQADQYIGPNSYADVVIHRKNRSETGNKLWITALADT